jgi:hypothetical protein
MATFTDRLMGEVIENPEGQERDVELLLVNLLRSLVEEQKGQTQELIPSAPETK